VTLERDNSAKRAFSELKNLAADAQALRGLNGTGHMQNHARVRRSAAGQVAQFYECAPEIFFALVRDSVDRRAFVRRATRGLAVAYEAHYEEFQRAPAGEAIRLLRAVGVAVPRRKEARGAALSSVRTVKSASEHLASMLLNFAAIDRAFIDHWPCVAPQLRATGPARFEPCAAPPRAGALPEAARDAAGVVGVRLRIVECGGGGADAASSASCDFALEQACRFKANALNRARCAGFAAREACGEDDRRRCAEAAARGVGRARITVFG